MVEGIHQLVELSKLDVQIADFDAQKDELPGERAALEAERAKAAALVEAAEQALGEAEQEQRRHEAVVQDQEALHTKLLGQQNQVKTNDAYTALLHEMDQAKAAISEAETAILEAMERLETAEQNLESAREAAREAEARIAGEERVIDDREKSIDQSLGNLHKERADVAEGVDATMLARYAKIASRRRPPVAMVQKETCMGCRVGLPPQLILEMHKGESLQTCGHCHRILVLEDPRGAS